MEIKENETKENFAKSLSNMKVFQMDFNPYYMETEKYVQMVNITQDISGL